MRIAILGAGGVGGYLGARLIAAGHSVAMLARGAHLAAIRERGLVLEEPGGCESAHAPALATDEPSALPAADLVIVAVKGQDLPALIPALAPAMAADGIALPFLNGVEAPDMLAAAFGEARTLIGTARISATIVAPGRVRKVTEGARFTIGTLDGRQHRAPVPAIRAAFAAAGIDAPDHPDLRVELWQKFVSLTALAAVTAGARAEIGRVRETPELVALLGRLIGESVALARARGIALPASQAADTLELLRRLPAGMRASLAHDLAAAKPLETDWLSGAVVRLGREAGIATPAHETVAALLAPYRRGAGRE